MVSRDAGWTWIPVSRYRVHFIIPGEASLRTEGSVMKSVRDRTACEFKAAPRDDTNQGALDWKDHRLHGVLHYDGFGHLRTLNAGGALSGRKIMSLWDAICTALRAREVSVDDASNKLHMQLRVLYPMALGHTWYGRWGYTIDRIPYNMSDDEWRDKLRDAHGVALEELANGSEPALTDLIKKYSKSELLLANNSRVTTVGHLFNFIMTAIEIDNAKPRPTGNADGRTGTGLWWSHLVVLYAELLASDQELPELVAAFPDLLRRDIATASRPRHVSEAAGLLRTARYYSKDYRGTATGPRDPATQAFVVSYRDDLRPVLLYMRPDAAVSDLKAAIEAELKLTYLAFETFQFDRFVEAPAALAGASDDRMIRDLSLPVATYLLVSGTGVLDDPELLLAGGPDRYAGCYDCKCGVTADDGARFVQCDTCRKWMHLHCEGWPRTAKGRPYWCRKCGPPPVASDMPSVGDDLYEDVYESPRHQDIDDVIGTGDAFQSLINLAMRPECRPAVRRRLD